MQHRATTGITALFASVSFMFFLGCALGPKPRYTQKRQATKTSEQQPATGNNKRDLSRWEVYNELDNFQESSGTVQDGTAKPRLYSLQADAQRSKLAASIRGYLDARYKYGGMDAKAVDCSGFVKAVYREVYGVELPHKAAEMYRLGVSVAQSALAAGDLVFFSGSRRSAVDHVGIYLSEKKFVHSTSSRGVIISTLDEDYWRRRYVGGRRW